MKLLTIQEKEGGGLIPRTLSRFSFKIKRLATGLFVMLRI